MRNITVGILIFALAACTGSRHESFKLNRVGKDTSEDIDRHGDVEVNRSYSIDTSGDYIVERGGSMLFYNQPSGVYYKGRYSRTYVSWLNVNKEVKLACYDDRTRSIFAFSKVLKWDCLDDHAQPVVHVMKKGKYAGHVIVAISSHNGPLMFTRSNLPESITEFTEMKVIDPGKCNYPSVIENEKGQMLMFYNRNDRDMEQVFARSLCFRRSDDGGDSWTDAEELVDFGKGNWIYYVKPAHTNDTIHLAFSVRIPGGDIVKNVYYMYSPDWGVTWYNNNDTNVMPPVHALTPLLLSPDTLQTRVWDIALSADKEPVISYVSYDTVQGQSYVAYKNADTWTHHFVSRSVNSYYPPGIVIDSRNTDVVYADESVDGGHVQITKKTLDKRLGTFKTSQIVSKETSRNQIHPQMIQNYNSMKLLWLDEVSYNNSQEYETNLKAYIAD